MQLLKHLNRPKNKEKLDSRRKCEAPVRWCSDLLVEWTHVKLWFDHADAQLLPSETLCLSQGLQSVASSLDVWMRESSVISFSRLLPVALSWDVRLRERRYQTVNVREKRRCLLLIKNVWFNVTVVLFCSTCLTQFKSWKLLPEIKIRLQFSLVVHSNCWNWTPCLATTT